jgi:hypothetical protein
LVFEELLTRSGHTISAGKLWTVEIPPEVDYALGRAELLRVMKKVGAVPSDVRRRLAQACTGRPTSDQLIAIRFTIYS